ncbi:MAG TPA: GNAT family N-acetyltransferase [Rhodobacteraceae bacterium]|jgi:putative acetyltransferase|nr:GNAT family N-acetyltransferase [Paracoccaceae bacterium]
MVTIAQEHPVQEALALLHHRHAADMHADTPPESIHMLPADALAAPGIWFYVLRDDAGVPLGMGAFKRIDATHAEVKSMHILAEARGRGLARIMVEHIIAAAQAEGFSRLSLETGVQPTFVSARALYARMGFEICGPFEGYGEDPNSVFMTREI